MQEAQPSKLGRYEVLTKIGEGGMASVYLGRRLGPAIAEDDDRFVALKVIRDDFALREEFVTMFLDEVRTVAALRHPSVVRLLEFGQEGRRLYCALELVSGQSLYQLWEACRMRQARPRYDWVAYVGARIAAGLHDAHELRSGTGEPLHLVHRDISPSNVLISYDGRVKIIDFGLAKGLHRLAKTTVGLVKGKYAYMAPEQAQSSKVDRRVDIFALGATLWEITCDRRLFKRKSDVETMVAAAEANVPDPCTLVMGYPRPLWRILRRALQKDADKRHPTALALAEDLDAFARSEGRRLGQKDVADVMQALFAYEAESTAAMLADASEVLTPGVSLERLSAVPASTSGARPLPEEWKRDLPAGLLNESKKPSS